VLAEIRLAGGLTSESVEGAALPLEGIDNIHGSDGLPLGMLGVGDSIPDDILQENLEHSPGLLIDEARNTLDTASAGQAPDGRLGDALDVVPEHLPVTLGAPLAESLASFAASSHDESFRRTDPLPAGRRIFIPRASLLLVEIWRAFLCSPGEETSGGRIGKLGYKYSCGSGARLSPF